MIEDSPPEPSAPLVSVCVANYNGEHILGECLASVLTQQRAPTFEIIVHDDASTDASLDALARFPSIQIIRAERNVGYCVSNNRMAKAAQGDFLLLLNNDARLLQDAMTTLLAMSRRCGHRSILGMPQYDAESNALIDMGCQLDWTMNPVARLSPLAGAPAMVIGACLWIPRTLWLEIGGFPEWFETNAEDVYLCCAARWLGYSVDVSASSGYRHLVGYTQGGGKVQPTGRLSLNRRRRYLSERNRFLIMWIFYPRWLLPLVLGLNTIALVLEALVLAICLRDTSLPRDIHWRSQRDAFRLCKEANMLRRGLLGRRRITIPAFFSLFTFLPQKLRLLVRFGIPSR